MVLFPVPCELQFLPRFLGLGFRVQNNVKHINLIYTTIGSPPSEYLVFMAFRNSPHTYPSTKYIGHSPF